MSKEKTLIEAKRHVAALKGFYIHLIVFLCVSAGLIAVNMATKTDWWAQWPLLGWGVGVLGHAVGVFSPVSLFGKDWEERKIRQHMADQVHVLSAPKSAGSATETPTL